MKYSVNRMIGLSIIFLILIEFSQCEVRWKVMEILVECFKLEFSDFAGKIWRKLGKGLQSFYSNESFSRWRRLVLFIINSKISILR